MEFLRRRKSSNNAVQTLKGIKSADGEEVCLVPVSKLATATQKTKGRKRYQGLIFALGGLFGILLAAFLADRSDMIHLSALPDLADLNLDSLTAILPAGVLKDAKDLTVSAYTSLTYD